MTFDEVSFYLLSDRMDEQSHQQAERFVEEFKQIDFQVPFDSLKRETIVVGGQKMYKDLYLVEKLLPTLMDGMVALTKQLEELMINSDQVDPEFRSRFNPCLYLGQYMMRCNHNLPGYSSHLSQLLSDYSRVENLNRYFLTRFQSLHRIFVKSIGKEKKNCDASQLRLFARELDQLLDCKGDLRNHLANSKALSRNKEEVKFNEILDEVAKFIVSKTSLTEEHFEKIFK